MQFKYVGGVDVENASKKIVLRGILVGIFAGLICGFKTDIKSSLSCVENSVIKIFGSEHAEGVVELQ